MVVGGDTSLSSSLPHLNPVSLDRSTLACAPSFSSIASRPPPPIVLTYLSHRLLQPSFLRITTRRKNLDCDRFIAPQCKPHIFAIMDSLTTHPSTAQQAKAFTSPASLSFPGGAGDLTPPSSEKDGQNLNGGSYADGKMNGQQQGGNVLQTPQTPTATPGAGVSGIVPTLQ